MMFFQDRTDAGKQLAKKLNISRPKDTIVLALPRGGVPLAIEISKIHALSFDVVHAKKMVHPLQTEFAIGAIAEKGEPLLNKEVNIEQKWIEQEAARVREEIARRRKLYDTFLTQRSLTGKDVILVDDGIATGMTLFAAIESVKNQQPNILTVSVPIIPKETYDRLKTLVDDIAYVNIPEQFLGALDAYQHLHLPLIHQEIHNTLTHLEYYSM